jgi:hypothetical protein
VHRSIGRGADQPAIAASTEDSSGPISLPDLNLPVAIEVGDVRVGNACCSTASKQLKGMQLAAHWTAEGMQIDSVHLNATTWCWISAVCCTPRAIGR